MKTVKLHTPVEVPKGLFSIGYDNRVFMIGSCFTENMGIRMTNLDFNVLINPFGILYNPLSMADALCRCLDNKRIDDTVLVQHEGLWHSWLHHGSYSRRDKEECLKACNEDIAKANAFLTQCDSVIVTFGSAWLYRLVDDGMVVANCHKVPAGRFDKCLASVDEVVNAWIPIVERLVQAGKNVVFSISPVRHLAYGAHGNQLGKAVLLLAIERIVYAMEEKKNRVTYFPAYEIVMDELRDYRFYADDMMHPSPLAEQIVWQRFQEAFMSQETIIRSEEIERAKKSLAHRPIHN